jgi:hypothetical protein
MKIIEFNFNEKKANYLIFLAKIQLNKAFYFLKITSLKGLKMYLCCTKL